MSAVQTPTETKDSARNTENASPSVGEYTQVPLMMIRRSPDNPRRHFDEEALKELAASIQQDGLLEPLVVRPASQEELKGPINSPPWVLIAGERRLRAMEMVFKSDALVPVIVRTLDRAAALKLTLTENLQRQDLDPIEEAEGYRALAELGMTQAEIGQAINRSQPAIANAMRLLELPEDVLKKIQAGQLSAAHGRALVKYAPWPQLCNAIAELAIEENYNSKRLEAGFGYEGISTYSLPGGVLVNVGYDMRSAAERAGLTVWDGGYTPDAEAYRQFVEERKAAEKKALEESLAAARAAAHASESVEEAPEELEELPGRDPNTKNGRRRLRKDAEKAAAPKLPNLSDLPYDSYEVVNKDTYGRPWPKACGPDCECRAKAIDRNGNVVEISTRPRHISALRGQELRKQKEAEKKRGLALEEKVHVRLASAPAFDTRGLAIVTAELLNAHQSYGSSSIDGDVRTSLLRRYLPDAKDYIYHGGVDNKALDTLASLPAQDIVSLLIEALLQTDLDRLKKNAGSPPKRLIWYLQEQRDEPKPEPARTMPEPCPAWPECDDDEGPCQACAEYQRWLDMEDESATSTVDAQAHVEVCAIAHRYGLAPEGVDTEDVEQLLAWCDGLRMDPTVAQEDILRLDELARVLAKIPTTDELEEAV